MRPDRASPEYIRERVSQLVINSGRALCIRYFTQIYQSLSLVSLSLNIVKKNLKGKFLKKQPVAKRITELTPNRFVFSTIFWSTNRRY